MKKIETAVLPILLLLSGCASMLPKDAVTQEVISEPKELFVEKKSVLMI